MIKNKFVLLFIVSLLTIISSIALNANAQKLETLLSADSRYGGSGGPAISISNIDGNTAIFLGGRGGWIINTNNNNAFLIGGGGYNLVNNIEVFENTNPNQINLDISYGGLELGYTSRSYRLVHFTFRILLGTGSSGNRTRNATYWVDNNYFFVSEPSLNLEANISRYFRANIGLSYRLISGSGHQTLSDSDLSGLSGVLSLKFGWF